MQFGMMDGYGYGMMGGVKREEESALEILKKKLIPDEEDFYQNQI